MKNVLYFDLETQKSAEEVGGWDKISRMGMSVGVTYNTATEAYKIYGEKQVDDLIKDLQRADLVAPAAAAQYAGEYVDHQRQPEALMARGGQQHAQDRLVRVGGRRTGGVGRPGVRDRPTGRRRQPDLAQGNGR